MAVRKTRTGKTTRKSPLKSASRGRGNSMPVSAAFKIFLLIVIIIAFFMVVQIIKKNVTITPKTAETEQQQEQPEKPLQPPEQAPTISAQNPPQKPPEKEPEKTPAAQPQPQTQEKPQPGKPAEQPAAQAQTKPQTEKPTTPAQPSTTPDVKPVETRNRSIYLIQEANMAQVKTNRSFKVSDRPLQDSINALLAGPTADERGRGIISVVPEGSKLLSVRVEGNTAVLNFNEEFRYNTRGSEGCAAQIKQIVWTATEFPNIQNVQFLIEGNQVKFLSEGVVIDSPIGR